MSKQNELVLGRLRRGPLTQLQAYDELGVTRLGARVFELRAAGYPIRSEMVACNNRQGERTVVAKYELEPKP